VETRLGRALLGGDIQDGATVRIDYTGTDLVVTFENLQTPTPEPAV
jgi:ATP-dependent Clp protease ATP-binding subunit ClpB